jgi:hypothetical protein
MQLHGRLLALLVLLMAPLGCTNPSELCELLPAQVNGWQAIEPDGVYDSETLYNYIDGGAEVYRALNVRAVCGRRYQRTGMPELVADVFLMASSADAFGAYHHDPRDGEPATFGQESEYSHGALAFWKGPYFVSIMTEQEDTDADKAVLELGRTVDEAIADAGEPPDLLALLPEQGLMRTHIRYFHSQLSLYRFYELAEGNPLELGPDTEGLLASYRPAAAINDDFNPVALLLVRYPGKARTDEAQRGFRQRYLQTEVDDGVGRSKDAGWAAVRTSDRLLVGVLDAPTRVEAERLLEVTIKRATRRDDSHE